MKERLEVGEKAVNEEYKTSQQTRSPLSRGCVFITTSWSHPTQEFDLLNPVGNAIKRKDVTNRGLTWDNVVTIPQARSPEQLNKEVEGEPIAVLDIRKTKTNVPREVSCRTAKFLEKFLERWKEFVLQWRKDNEYSLPEENSLVFTKPKINRPYTYSIYANV